MTIATRKKVEEEKNAIIDAITNTKPIIASAEYVGENTVIFNGVELGYNEDKVLQAVKVHLADFEDVTININEFIDRYGQKGYTTWNVTALARQLNIDFKKGFNAEVFNEHKGEEIKVYVREYTVEREDLNPATTRLETVKINGYQADFQPPRTKLVWCK